MECISKAGLEGVARRRLVSVPVGGQDQPTNIGELS